MFFQKILFFYVFSRSFANLWKKLFMKNSLLKYKYAGHKFLGNKEFETKYIRIRFIMLNRGKVDIQLEENLQLIDYVLLQKSKS